MQHPSDLPPEDDVCEDSHRRDLSTCIDQEPATNFAGEDQSTAVRTLVCGRFGSREITVGVEETPSAEDSELSDKARAEVIALIAKEREAREEAALSGNLLPEDTFSFFVFADVQSFTFFVAFSTFCIQIATLAFLTADILNSGDTSADNPLGVPLFVTWPVRASQLLAMLIGVLSQTDVLWSVNILYNGYNETALTEILNEESRRPRCLKLRWFTSILCRFAEGAFCLAATFILIMRSDTVRDLLLNFTAVEFISYIDNGVFLLAKWRYFGNQVKEDTNSSIIGEEGFAVRGECCPPLGGKLLLHSLTLFIIFLTMMVFWIWISVDQSSGKFLPQSIYVQFGADENSTLEYLSGFYDVSSQASFFSKSNQVKYVARASSSSSFEYCDKDQVWVFLHDIAMPTRSANVCQDWIVKSSETVSFDILSVANSEWFVKTKGGSVRMRSFRMFEQMESCPGKYFGPGCLFADPCESMALDRRFLVDFLYDPSVENAEQYFEYGILRDGSDGAVLFNGRPVYNSPADFTLSPSYKEALVVFLARRWVHLVVLGGSIEEVLQFLLTDKPSHQRLGTYPDYVVSHISEAVDVGTLKDGGSPDGLKWYRTIDMDKEAPAAEARPDHSRAPVDYAFECDKCLICPDGSSISDINKNKATEYLGWRYGQYQTCDGLRELASDYSCESSTCFELQAAAIAECGCPYFPPNNELSCPLCPGEITIPDSTAVPFPLGNTWGGNLTCGQLVWKLRARYSDPQDTHAEGCSAIQATYGAVCGCSDSPPASCEVKCPPGKHFDMQTAVPRFSSDQEYNRWHCGEILYTMSGEFPSKCRNKDYTSALVGACCRE